MTEPASTRNAAREEQIEADGRRLRLTNLDRVLWPRAGFTKRDMLAYYREVAAVILPHLAERPLTLRRFPEGVEHLNWYQTQCRGRPDWMPVASIPGRRGAVQNYCVVNDVPSLLWAVNLGTIELHPLLGLRGRLDRPSFVVFDLDPGEGADVIDCCQVALWVRDLLDVSGVASFPKTSGSGGLHVYAPLNSDHDYAKTKTFARRAADALAERHPDRVVSSMTRALRRGKVLIDWLQNDPTRSTVAVYSLRGMAWPTVSTPVTWDEIEAALSSRRAERLTFVAEDIPARLERYGDLFGDVLTTVQTLPDGEVMDRP